MTVLQEIIKEFENIKLTKCKTIQEMMFFDGVLAIIEGKYIEKEKQQIIEAHAVGRLKEISGNKTDGYDYYEKLSTEAEC